MNFLVLSESLHYSIKKKKNMILARVLFITDFMLFLS